MSLTGNISFANELCAQLNTMSKTGKAPDIQKSNLNSCGPVRETDGSVSNYCFWEFDFRSKTAKQHYANLKAKLGKCASVKNDEKTSQVNHPDSYDQALFENADNRFSLSLKDKAGLNKTMVFLRAGQK